MVEKLFNLEMANGLAGSRTIVLDPRCITMIHSEQSVAVETLASSSCIRCLLIHRVSIPYHIFVHHIMIYPFRITNRRFELLKLTSP
jgi:hypothetical protein